MGEQRQEGWSGWLAAYSHGNGSAGYYWVWDPDSRDQYMEAQGPYAPGELPKGFGQKNADGSGKLGMGWQLPLLAVFTDRPTNEDLMTLQRADTPYVVLSGPVSDDEPDPPVTPPDEAEKLAGEALKAILDESWTEAIRLLRQIRRL
jgi:hypothetical protein